MAHDTSHDAHGTIWQRIWVPFFILCVITGIEFIIALAIPNTILSHGVKSLVYIILTLVKAFYIMGFFMHLKFEVKHLIYTIILPMIFLVYLVVLLLLEGGHIRQNLGH